MSRQPPAVDYMDNYLSQHHAAFDWINSQTKFDAQAGAYVPLVGVVGHAAPDSPHRSRAQLMARAPRPFVPAADKLKFWESIFPKAMESLKNQHPVEPKGRTESGYSIRSLTCWEDVSAKLQEARDRYEDSAGVAGGFKKMMRKGADKAKVAQAVINFVPEMDYVSPVLAVLKVVLNVSASTPGNARKCAKAPTIADAFCNRPPKQHRCSAGTSPTAWRSWSVTLATSRPTLPHSQAMKTLTGRPSPWLLPRSTQWRI